MLTPALRFLVVFLLVLGTSGVGATFGSPGCVDDCEAETGETARPHETEADGCQDCSVSCAACPRCPSRSAVACPLMTAPLVCPLTQAMVAACQEPTLLVGGSDIFHPPKA